MAMILFFEVRQPIPDVAHLKKNDNVSHPQDLQSGHHEVPVIRDWAETIDARVASTRTGQNAHWGIEKK